MKTIFKNIEGRKWKYNDHVITDIEYTDIARIWVKHKKLYQWNLSLADLLANKSWCKAVWSKSDSINICPLCSYHNYTGIEIFEHYSFKAFVILQQQDEKACITYIKKTMI